MSASRPPEFTHDTGSWCSSAPGMFFQTIAGLVLGVVLAAFLVRASRAW